MIFTLPMGPKRPNSRARCASFTWCTAQSTSQQMSQHYTPTVAAASLDEGLDVTG
jgi:hypothetical protein